MFSPCYQPTTHPPFRAVLQLDIKGCRKTQGNPYYSNLLGGFVVWKFKTIERFDDRNHTVIRSVWVSAKFGTCAVVSVNGTLVEAKMWTFTLEYMHFIFNKCPIYTHDNASAKFSTNSHGTDYSANANCLHLKQFTCKRALRQVFICLGPLDLLGFCLGCSSNCVGSGSGQIQSVKLLQNMVSNSNKHLPQSLFTGQFFLDDNICSGVFIVN